jgi:NAD(P)-dependent dehydrogenase (short-subunit alcohol dehydrogenase family)
MNFEQKLQSPPIEKEKIIITGGTEGIGRAIAMELAEQDHDVVICARTQEKLDEIKNSTNIDAYQLDLSETNKIEDFIKQGSEKLGGLNILILNAAVTGIRESEDYTLKVDCEAQKALVESASDLLRASNGRIVFLTSAQAKKFIEGHEQYGQEKKNVEDWLKEFSDKEENKNIQIFLVNPGHVDTRMNEEAINYGVEQIRERSIKAKDEGKFRDPQIVGRIISKMSVSGKKFNIETNEYDTAIMNNEIVAISDDNVKFES